MVNKVLKIKKVNCVKSIQNHKHVYKVPGTLFYNLDIISCIKTMIKIKIVKLINCSTKDRCAMNSDSIDMT